MGKRIPIEVGEYYHVYNRGVDKRILFKDKFDHLRFIGLLYICNGQLDVDIHSFLQKKEGPTFFDVFQMSRGEPLVSIGAYCLMPNHFHILLRERTEGGTSAFMKKLSTAYAMYFNHRYERSGTLFEGRYKAKHADNDRYLEYLFAYIHLNPVKIIDPKWKEVGIRDQAKARTFLEEYQYSSYPTYVGKKTLQGNILESKEFPEYFATAHDFSTLTDSWLTLHDYQ